MRRYKRNDNNILGPSFLNADYEPLPTSKKKKDLHLYDASYFSGHVMMNTVITTNKSVVIPKKNYLKTIEPAEKSLPKLRIKKGSELRS